MTFLRATGEGPWPSQPDAYSTSPSGLFSAPEPLPRQSLELQTEGWRERSGEGAVDQQ